MLPNILLFKFWKYLSVKRKWQLFFTLIISVISGISELLVINSAIPFLAILTGVKDLSNYPISIILSKALNIQNNQELITPIIIFFGLNIFIATFLRLLNIWIINYVAALIGIDFNTLAVSKTIYQPYKFHKNYNSSKLIAANTIYINRTCYGIFNSLYLICNLILGLIIGIAIVTIHSTFASISLLIISIFYFFIGKNLNKKVSLNGKKIAFNQEKKVKSLQEVIGSIRSVLLDSNQDIYIKEIKKVDRISRILDAQNIFIAEFPRYIIEGIVFLIITFSSLIIINNTQINKSTSFLVLLGSFTLAVQRLLPVIQRIYNSWVVIKSVNADSENIHKTFQMKIENNTKAKIIPMKLNNSIKLESIYYSYTNKKNILSNINLEIFQGEKIGIIGKTGSGKSTLVDLIMGLLKPSMGNIYVDGKNLYDNKYPNRINEWMRSISHVPQDIFLTDATIAENIAFGTRKDLISNSKIINAAKMAQIHQFIRSTDNGYETYVGERGIKLSGGQRQRIGIARALYKKSKILIFDEATSALDNETEDLLMKSINEISDKITIISIAHRITTLKNCDRIFEIKNGLLFSNDSSSEIFSN